MKKISLPLLLLSIMFSSVYGMEYTINLKNLTGNTQSIKVTTTDTIESLKEKIQNETGVTPEEQILICNGKLLNDAQKTIGNYNIKENADIQLVKKVEVGPNPHSQPREGVVAEIYWGRLLAAVAVITVVVVVISSTVYYAFSYQTPKKKRKKKEAASAAQVEEPKQA